MKLGAIYRSFKPPRVTEAVAAYEKARTLDPKNGQALLGVARSYRAGKQWARAISAYERVEQAYPRLKGEALLGTAWCHLLSGEDSKARFYTGLAVNAGRGRGRDPAGPVSPGGDPRSPGASWPSSPISFDRRMPACRPARRGRSWTSAPRPSPPSPTPSRARARASRCASGSWPGWGAWGPPRARRCRSSTASPRPRRPRRAQDSREEKARLDREARLVASAQAAGEKIRGRRPEAP